MKILWWLRLTVGGMVKSLKLWMIRSQDPKQIQKKNCMDKVQRLDGSGLNRNVWLKV